MSYTSANGKLTLEAKDLDGDKERYQRISGKLCPLSYQQLIDLISTWDDDKDDEEFVQSIEEYAIKGLSDAVKNLESGVEAEHVAKLSDN